MNKRPQGFPWRTDESCGGNDHPAMSIWEQSAGLQRADHDAGDMAEPDGAMSFFCCNWSGWLWCFEAVRKGEALHPPFIMTGRTRVSAQTHYPVCPAPGILNSSKVRYTWLSRINACVIINHWLKLRNHGYYEILKHSGRIIALCSSD